MRAIHAPPPDLVAPATPRVATWTVPIRAITPIYKGGAHPKQVDAGVPFRGASLRGLLRAWWRATQDTTSVSRLRDLERERFGAVFDGSDARGPRASRVRLAVIDASSRPGEPPPDLQYVTWVDRPQDRTGPTWHHDARGTLLVSAEEPAWRGELERALAAMLLVGGIGSRSRRGAGALEADGLTPPPRDGADLAAQLTALAPRPAARPWPSLAGARVMWLDPRGDALDALRAALGGLRGARGMRQTGPRSFEGDRRIPAIQRDWLALRDGGAGFRGVATAFGLPLVYRSANGHLRGPDGRDRTVTLNATGAARPGVRIDRLPSPALVRPVRLASGRFLPVILLLRPWAEVGFTAQGGISGRPPADALDLLAAHLTAEGWSTSTLGGGR